MTSVMKDSVIQTPTNGYDYYNFFSGPNGVVAYGHGACYGGLSPLDCFVCLNTCMHRLSRECGYSIGAQVQLKDCRMRYENDPFTD